MRSDGLPSVFVSLLPVGGLLLALILTIIFAGASMVSEISSVLLIGASIIALVSALLCSRLTSHRLGDGLRRSARQILPAVPMLLLIGMLSSVWMMSGVVPLLIKYGLSVISPVWFPVITCFVCTVISVLTGSSWTTIATIGVAFMGMGSVLGYSMPLVAGAVISGAYFGDKVSPLSDTTVLAASSCGLDLFDHIRFMMRTTIPALIIALIFFTVAGYVSDATDIAQEQDIVSALESVFVLTPWLLFVPAITLVLIIFRVNTLITLGISAFLGLLAMLVFQPDVVALVSGDGGFAHYALASVKVLFTTVELPVENPELQSLLSTGGMLGMLPTVILVLSAMLFGGMLLGTGMLRSLTMAITDHLRGRAKVVAATVASGLFLNATTADQYLSIIVGGNMYRGVYDDNGLQHRLLSRTLEDSISVTSVLIPWNSCGVTHSAVLGVATMSYLPFCIFNIMSPLMSLLYALLADRLSAVGVKMRSLKVTLENS